MVCNHFDISVIIESRSECIFLRVHEMRHAILILNYIKYGIRFVHLSVNDVFLIYKTYIP